MLIARYNNVQVAAEDTVTEAEFLRNLSNAYGCAKADIHLYKINSTHYRCIYDEKKKAFFSHKCIETPPKYNSDGCLEKMGRKFIEKTKLEYKTFSQGEGVWKS